MAVQAANRNKKAQPGVGPFSVTAPGFSKQGKSYSVHRAPEGLPCEGARLHVPTGAVYNEAALVAARRQSQNDDVRLLKAHQQFESRNQGVFQVEKVSAFISGQTSPSPRG